MESVEVVIKMRCWKIYLIDFVSGSNLFKLTRQGKLEEKEQLLVWKSNSLKKPDTSLIKKHISLNSK